jgi:glycosyltransferase involved in cell wall biosynthesis
MKVAYFDFPHLGGTFQVFRHLREGLSPLGTDVQWVGLGEGARRALSETRWSAESECGFAVDSSTGGGDAWARQLVATLDARGFSAVFVNVLADAVQTNLARYLPPEILRILIVHNITPGTYGAALAIRDHVHATVAISPRIKDDLLRRYRFRPERVVVIPHATDPWHGESLADGATDEPLRVLFLGRIEDQSKGVLSLPAIFERLPPGVTLTIAGDGPDLENLKRRCQRFGRRVCFLGAVQHDAVSQILARHHVMVMPSRFEGFGLTLIEAMAAGCIPVASRIRGVTDWIVEDGCNGMLFSMGNNGEASERIGRLAYDRALLRTMSLAARNTARCTFDRATMASRYGALLKRLRDDPPPIAAPLNLDRWKMPQGLHDSLRTRIPLPIKNFLRRVNESLAL